MNEKISITEIVKKNALQIIGMAEEKEILSEKRKCTLVVADLTVARYV